jgi:predicted molibdopterin-dependent oxidoreductase YjgC
MGAIVGWLASRLPSDTTGVPGGSRLGIIASSQLTNEELYLIREIFGAGLGARVTAAVPRPTGFSDDFLIKADKTPNTAGATLLGLAGLDAPAATSLLTDALDGKLDGLWVFGHDLAHMIGEPELEELSRKLDLLIFSGPTDNRTAAVAHWALPTAAYLEKDGTFVNCHGWVQRVNRAFPPLADAREDWRLLLDIARDLGHELSYRNPQETFAEMSKTVAPFAELSYKTLGSLGAALAGVRRAEGAVAP